MDTDGKPKLEDKIESRLLPVLYTVVVVLVILLLLAFVVMAWKSAL